MFSMNQRLLDKMTLITGGAHGLGLSIAKAFIDQGAWVILTDIDDIEGQKQAEKLGKKARFLHLDVCDPVQWQLLNEELRQSSRSLDVLVNNAGICCEHSPTDFQNDNEANLETWERLHLANSEGIFWGCKFGIQLMKENSKPASIINISPRSGTVGVPGSFDRSPSRDSVRNHTKSISLYCAQNSYPIRCNSIHPTAILTPLWEPVLGKGSERKHNLEKLSREVPLKRMGTLDEVAAAAVFLASDECLFMTGSEIVIDGGISAVKAG